jgi:hypothetical protein
LPVIVAGTQKEMTEKPAPIGRYTRIAIRAGSGIGILGGLAIFMAGQIVNQPFRLSLPGLLVVIGTMTSLAAIGLLRLRAYPVMIAKPERRLDFRPRNLVPIRYWSLLIFSIFASIFFFISAIRMFSGWIPEGSEREFQRAPSDESLEAGPDEFN